MDGMSGVDRSPERDEGPGGAVSDIVMYGGRRPMRPPVPAGSPHPLRRPGDISEVEAALMASMSEAIAELQALSRDLEADPVLPQAGPRSPARTTAAGTGAASLAQEAPCDTKRDLPGVAAPSLAIDTVEIVVSTASKPAPAAPPAAPMVIEAPMPASSVEARPAVPDLRPASPASRLAAPEIAEPETPAVAISVPERRAPEASIARRAVPEVPALPEAPPAPDAPIPASAVPRPDRAVAQTAKVGPGAPLAPLLEGKAGGSPIVSGRDGADAETGGNGRKPGTPLHQKSGAPNFRTALSAAIAETRRSLLVVFGFTIAINLFVLAIPVYLFQISDRVLTSRSLDTLAMLTLITVGAIVGQVLLDILRRRILMRTAASIEVRLGAPILSAAARSALGGSGRDYQILGDLAHLRSFLTGGTLLAMLDAPLAPIFLLAVWFVHPHLGIIVAVSIALLLVVAILNKRATAAPFAEANAYTSMANLNLEALSRNSQIINALGMIPEAVRMWGRENAKSLGAQALAQDRNVLFSGLSKAVRLGTQVTLLGWGAMLALEGHLTGGMVISSSIIASRALAPVEGTIEGWRTYIQSKTAFGRISNLLRTSPLNMERLRLPAPLGRLDVDRILFVPPQTKKVILNGLSFRLAPGESMAIIGSSGAGKSTLGKMLVGSIIPTAGSIRLDLMDLKNWDARQFGESIGYLPQDIQLFPASIKANIARMREDVTDEMIFEAAALADVHELIASFPQGYETMIGSDGAPLSGGQKQRIGLARAFFGNPKLVVLDEPNSNLDTAGEQALAQALIAAKKKGTTVVAITQRTALLRCVDKIMIMKDGTVQAIGERQKILKALAEQKKAGTAPKDLLLAE